MRNVHVLRFLYIEFIITHTLLQLAIIRATHVGRQQVIYSLLCPDVLIWSILGGQALGARTAGKLLKGDICLKQVFD